MNPFTERFLASLGLSFVPVIMTGYSIVETGNSYYFLFVAWFFGFTFFTFFAFFYYSIIGGILWGVAIGSYGAYFGLTSATSLNVILIFLGAVYFPATYAYAYYSLKESKYIPHEPKYSKEDFQEYFRGMGWTPKDEQKEPEVRVITKVVERVKEVPRRLTNGELGRVINYWQQKFNEAPEGSREKEVANRKIREYQDDYMTQKNAKRR